MGVEETPLGGVGDFFPLPGCLEAGPVPANSHKLCASDSQLDTGSRASSTPPFTSSADVTMQDMVVCSSPG